MPEKVVLAYSGGLDTSIIIPWLKENYACEVIAMVADVGQGDDIDAVVEKAYKTGASKVVVEDLREEFLTGYVFPSLQAGAVYEHKYLLGTSMARPVIAKYQVDVALREGATAVAHGCTGKGNDQVRFELTYQALAPQLKVIAPWREWTLKSREDCLDYAEAHGIKVGSRAQQPCLRRDLMDHVGQCVRRISHHQDHSFRCCFHDPRHKLTVNLSVGGEQLQPPLGIIAVGGASGLFIDSGRNHHQRGAGQIFIIARAKLRRGHQRTSVACICDNAFCAFPIAVNQDNFSGAATREQ